MTEDQGFASVKAGQMPSGGPNRARFDERPAAVRKWIEDLPLGNLPETGRRVHGCLIDLQQIGLAPRARLRVLGQLEETVDYVFAGLGKLYANQPFPLASRARRAARLVITLCEAMARNYRMCLLGDAGGFMGLRKRERALVMTGVCHHSGRALLECWLLFEQPPAGIWRLLHDTYHVAADENLHRVTCIINKRHMSVNSCYKQLLLTDAINPWRMPRGEVLDVYRTLGLCAHVATLDSIGSGRLDQDRPVFLVDPNRDVGSLPARAVDSLESADGMLLHTDKLAAALETPLQQRRWPPWKKPEKRTITEAERQRIREIEMMLAVPVKRRSERIEVEERAQIVVGLTAIHHLLQSEVDARLAASTDAHQQARFESRDFSGGEQDNLRRHEEKRRVDAADVWDMVYSGRGASASAIPEDSITEHMVASVPTDVGSSGPGVSRRRIQTEDFWSLADISATGFCLKAPADAQSTAEAGDLVLVKTASVIQGDGWQIGMVRWLRNSAAGGIRIGVQRLAGAPKPLLASVAKPDGSRTDTVRTLLLPADPVYNAPATLITPVQNYLPETDILLSDGIRSFELKLGRLLEDLGGVRQFTFVGNDSVPESATDAGEDPSEWDSL